MINLLPSFDKYEEKIIEIDERISKIRNTIELMLERVSDFKRYIYKHGLNIMRDEVEITLCHQLRPREVDRDIEIGDLMKFITACDTQKLESTVFRPGFKLLAKHSEHCNKVKRHTDYSDSQQFMTVVNLCDFGSTPNSYEDTQNVVIDENNRQSSYDIDSWSHNPTRTISIQVNIHEGKSVQHVLIQMNSECTLRLDILDGKDEISDMRLSDSQTTRDDFVCWYGLAMTIGRFNSKYSVYMTDKELNEISRFDTDLHLYLRIHEDAIEPFQSRSDSDDVF